jgi:elongation of very long chain fatty acids protein 4
MNKIEKKTKMKTQGKVDQVSFLHVYHHSSIGLVWWLVARSEPGGDAYWSACLNSLVHVIMYAYYCCTALKARQKTKKKRSCFSF